MNAHYPGCPGFDRCTCEQHDEDARLEEERQERIRDAAPDMLEALEVIRTVATEPHHENALTAIRDLAKNAIAAATGEAR